MVNKKKWLGILSAIVMVFGMTGIAFAQSGGGTFTLTDIPSRFYGRYVLLYAETNNGELIGAQNYNLASGTATLPRIANGRVSIPMWILLDDGRTEELVRYNGNRTVVDVEIEMYDTATLDNNSNSIAYIEFYVVSFSNGSAAMTFQDFDYFGEY